jgi:hypothetical protein
MGRKESKINGYEELITKPRQQKLQTGRVSVPIRSEKEKVVTVTSWTTNPWKASLGSTVLREATCHFSLLTGSKAGCWIYRMNR